jgi:hypothetical protein
MKLENYYMRMEKTCFAFHEECSTRMRMRVRIRVRTGVLRKPIYKFSSISTTFSLFRIRYPILSLLMPSFN